ncbi:MAG: glucose-6-phosphate isomerase family protein [Anaerolineae bacterium]
MQDLTAQCGFPLALDDAGRLVFGPDVVVDEHKERTLDALADVAMEPAVCRGSSAVAYYMDNGVYRRQDQPVLQGLPFRYELTLLPDTLIGRECNKTFGHIHLPDPKTGMTWAEVCEVVTGTAHFIFQTFDPAGPDALKVWCLEAKAGQKVVFPPDLDHLTINPGPGPLLFSDVIALGVSGNYERFRSAQGGAVYEVMEQGQRRFVPNPRYRKVGELQMLYARDYPTVDLTSGEPLYSAFVRTRGAKWPFLLDPRLTAGTFPDLAAAFAV